MSTCNNMILKMLLLLTALTSAVSAEEQDKSKTMKAPQPLTTLKPALGMTVSGNLEAPKVLYILPWKTLEQATVEPYISRIIDDVYAPIDDEEFIRSVRWHEQASAPQGR